MMPYTTDQVNEFLSLLKKRFTEKMHRHQGLEWSTVESRLHSSPEKLLSLLKMEETGGEPDVIYTDTFNQEIVFFDFSPESPKGRRSLCYDQLALDSRREHKPNHSAVGMAMEMGVELLTEEQYQLLQAVEPVDKKSSSWIATPDSIRTLGGALFGDNRFGRVFTYCNGAESYYSVRGFRASLKL
jgi:hypothetical protein